MWGVKRSAVLGAMALCCACAPTRPQVEDGCADAAFPEDLPVPVSCEWPAWQPVPMPPRLVREGPPAPGTAVMPGHPDVLDHGPRDAMRVALTFDACSTTEVQKYDERIVHALVQQKVPATIFIGGSWAKDEPEALKALAKNPLFELGNHTYTHPHLMLKTDDRIREELARTQEEIFGLTGVKPLLFRPPFGEYDDRVVKIAQGLGLRTVEYDLPSGDPGAPKDKLVEWVLQQARPGSIVVMHLNHVKFHTADALPEIITGLRARGFTLVKVSDLAGGAASAGAVASAAGPKSTGARFPEEQLRDARNDKVVQPANLVVPAAGVEPLRTVVEVGHQEKPATGR
jgi:peptidoglycan-N-acetylglucosamine deacetylase